MVYKWLNARLDEFIDGFDELLQCISSTGLDFIYIGDFNYNLLNLEADNFDFFYYMISNNLYPFACVPTRISSHSASVIDNVSVGSIYLNHSCADVVVHSGSDRLPVVTQLTCLKKVYNRSKK